MCGISISPDVFPPFRVWLLSDAENIPLYGKLIYLAPSGLLTGLSNQLLLRDGVMLIYVAPSGLLTLRQSICKKAFEGKLKTERKEHATS